MNHESVETGDALTIRLSGTLSFDDHSEFRGLLNKTSSMASKHLVLDVGNLDSIDSAGLGMLMIAHETSENEHWKLTIARPHGQVKRMLELTEFNKIMSITG